MEPDLVAFYDIWPRKERIYSFNPVQSLHRVTAQQSALVKTDSAAFTKQTGYKFIYTWKFQLSLNNDLNVKTTGYTLSEKKTCTRRTYVSSTKSPKVEIQSLLYCNHQFYKYN